MDTRGSRQEAVLRDETDHRLVQEDKARLPAGILCELVGEVREAMVEQAMQALLREIAHVGEGDRQRVELDPERLRMEVAARVQAGRLLAVGRQDEGAVRDRAELAVDLR